MYLFYLDESGLPKGRSTEYFVVAGLALHEDDCWPFARSLDNLQRRLLGAPDDTLELHASRIWTGRSEWSHVSRTARHNLIDKTFQHLKTWTAPSGRSPRYFAVAVHKHSFPGQSSLELAHEQLLARMDAFLTREHLAGNSHRSLVIADKSGYEQLMQGLVASWKVGGGSLGRLHGLIEVPLYVDSKASRLIQAVDFVAWAVYSYYENLHVEWIQKLHERFDSDSGVQHGLTHLVRKHRMCACAPCVSRARNSVPAVVLSPTTVDPDGYFVG